MNNARAPILILLTKVCLGAARLSRGSNESDLKIDRQQLKQHKFS